MNTKYNTGDQVLIPATIRTAKQTPDGIVYDVEAAWEVPESMIQDDRLAIGAEMRAFEAALPRR